MPNYKRDRLLLLKALNEFVEEALENAKINPLLDDEVADLVITLTDKRKTRRLKNIHRALDTWIKDGVELPKI